MVTMVGNFILHWCVLSGQRWKVRSFFLSQSSQPSPREQSSEEEDLLPGLGSCPFPPGTLACHRCLFKVSYCFVNKALLLRKSFHSVDKALLISALFQFCMWSSFHSGITLMVSISWLTNDHVKRSCGLLVESCSHIPSARCVFYQHLISFVCVFV